MRRRTAGSRLGRGRLGAATASLLIAALLVPAVAGARAKAKVALPSAGNVTVAQLTLRSKRKKGKLPRIVVANKRKLPDTVAITARVARDKKSKRKVVATIVIVNRDAERGTAAARSPVGSPFVDVRFGTRGGGISGPPVRVRVFDDVIGAPGDPGLDWRGPVRQLFDPGDFFADVPPRQTDRFARRVLSGDPIFGTKDSRVPDQLGAFYCEGAVIVLPDYRNEYGGGVDCNGPFHMFGVRVPDGTMIVNHLPPDGAFGEIRSEGGPDNYYWVWRPGNEPFPPADPPIFRIATDGPLPFDRTPSRAPHVAELFVWTEPPPGGDPLVFPFPGPFPPGR